MPTSVLASPGRRARLSKRVRQNTPSTPVGREGEGRGGEGRGGEGRGGEGRGGEGRGGEGRTMVIKLLLALGCLIN